jgi:NAD-dependent SIR2 family protein deacetylase
MFIALTNATRVAGASMSTAAGFPDMQSSLAMFGNFFEQSGMEQDRARWDTRAKQLVQQAQETQATLCHSWLDLLARNGKLLRLFPAEC